jgi:transcriptional regulator of acetoin/glycerol metabolism
VIAEGRPVAVLGSAHYEERNRGLFCYATPIRDAHGDVVAVLDVTGPIAAHDAAVGVAVEQAGFALERALKARAFAAVGAATLRTIERLVLASTGPAFVCDVDGELRVVNEAARRELGLRGPATCARVFGSTFAAMLGLAIRGERSAFETRSASYDVELDPILAGGGRAIGLAIRLTPRRRSSPPPFSLRAAPRGPLPAAFDTIVSADPRVDQAKADAARLARTDLPVLLLAETGTGKELFARAIHAASAVAGGPFIALNCGAFTESLLETELFGHAPHAFTGAARGGADGKLAAAHGGTLFLDEIAEMPERVQVALLRVLEDGAFSRVGESRERRASFRLVGATCRDLPALVERGAFRRDLFYRVQGAVVALPPLRERSDVVDLARAILRGLRAEPTELAPDAVEWLRAHDWPGNVRELKSALAHAVALSERSIITRDDFPRPLLTSPARTAPTNREAILQDAMDEALAACGGNVTLAAARLGVARSTLYRMRSRRQW